MNPPILVVIDRLKSIKIYYYEGAVNPHDLQALDRNQQIDEDHYVPAPIDSTCIPPGSEVEPHDRGFSGVRGDHSGPPGGGAAVSAEAGIDVKSLPQKYQPTLIEVFVLEYTNENLKMRIIDVVDDRDWLQVAVPFLHKQHLRGVL